MAQLVEQLIRNEQAVGSSPTISSKTCVNTAFSQVFSFLEKNFKIHYATKKSHSFYGVICITDKRTIFVTNSDKFHSVREFSNREVIDVLLDKMFKAGRLKIQTSNGNFVFSIFKYENAQKFLQIIKTHMMTP